MYKQEIFHSRPTHECISKSMDRENRPLVWLRMNWLSLRKYPVACSIFGEILTDNSQTNLQNILQFDHRFSSLTGQGMSGGPNTSFLQSPNLEVTMGKPQARSHFHSARSHPSHTSFTAQSSCPHMCGSFSLLVTNMTIPGQNYKCLSDHSIVTLAPNEEEFARKCGQEHVIQPGAQASLLKYG